MANDEVLWEEGMFLRPHQLQAAQRSITGQALRSAKWDSYHNWGLRRIEIDADALANHRLVIHKLEARMLDGTMVSVPEDGSLQPVDLKEALVGQPNVTVLLAVPLFNASQANTSTSAGNRRFLIRDQADVPDENNPSNLQVIRFRSLNLKLLLSTQDQSGYEILKIAQITKSMQGDARPQVDETYIPPLLGCDAWKSLWVGFMQALYERVGKLLEDKAKKAASRGLSFDNQGPADLRLFEQLRALNQAFAMLGTLAYANGIHPLVAYFELGRLVGQLVIFCKALEQRMPELPRYDHDDLGTCFFTLRRLLDTILKEFEDLAYVERPFEGNQDRMEVKMEPPWLQPNWQMYVGASSELPRELCVKLLTKEGGLDMKIGSSGRVDEIFKYGKPGLAFTHIPNPPGVLPQSARNTYFQIDRSKEQTEWKHVNETFSLAIRLNNTRIAGSIQGQQVLTLKPLNLAGGAKTPAATMRFTLYLLPIGMG